MKFFSFILWKFRHLVEEREEKWKNFREERKAV
jgi:hypothetical protein